MAKLIYLQGLSDRQHPNQLLMDVIAPDIKKGPWIAGGAAISLYTKQFINDIDVYVSDKTQKLVLEAYLQSTHDVTYESDNALTATVMLDSPVKHKVQVIRKGIYNSISDVFDTFDFSICQIATDGRGNFVATPQALADLGTKRLRVAHFNPDGFISRWAKYTMYGYDLPTEEFADYASRIDSQQFKEIHKFSNNY